MLWGLLPFLMAAVGGIWWALEHSYHTARLTEVLTIAPDEVHLVRTNPRGDTQEWDCNRYWAKVEMHPNGGPVEHYITLKGGRARGGDRRVPLRGRAQGPFRGTDRRDFPARCRQVTPAAAPRALTLSQHTVPKVLTMI